MLNVTAVKSIESIENGASFGHYTVAPKAQA